jgi:DNA invertase Pin-like site-specific DNA recombinase
MKKFMTLMLGMSLVLGTVATSFAQEKKEDTKKEQKKSKKSKKKEGEEKKH